MLDALAILGLAVIVVTLRAHAERLRQLEETPMPSQSPVEPQTKRFLCHYYWTRSGYPWCAMVLPDYVDPADVDGLLRTGSTCPILLDDACDMAARFNCLVNADPGDHYAKGHA